MRAYVIYIVNVVVRQNYRLYAVCFRVRRLYHAHTKNELTQIPPLSRRVSAVSTGPISCLLCSFLGEQKTMYEQPSKTNKRDFHV